jgi:hypothetical protein
VNAEKQKVVVPPGMIHEASASTTCTWAECEKIIRIVLEYQRRNPVVPTEEQVMKLCNELSERGETSAKQDRIDLIVEFQRRLMYLAPDSDEPIKDLLWNTSDQSRVTADAGVIHEKIREAYKRGKECK